MISSLIINRFKIVAILIAVIMGLSSFTFQQRPHRQAGEWEHIGSRKVNFGVEKDIMTVAPYERPFRKLRVKVTGGSLNMHKMIVVYGNGTREQLNIRHNFSKGSATRVIDLQGGKRKIRKVSFWYDTKNTSNRRATVHLFGRH